MSEFYPVQGNTAIEQGAVEAASEHWKAYYTNPAFGDEHTWDAVITNAIVDLGVPRDRASSINEVAKLDTQF